MTKKLIFISAVIVMLASCKSSERIARHKKIEENTFPEVSIMERPLPDSRGIITYKDYQIIVANGNETVEALANRLGIEPTRLASYNGVLSSYLLRKDEILALPFRISGEPVSASSGWNEEAIAKSIKKDKPKIGTPYNPIRHRIQPGETAYIIARLYNVSVTSLAKWNGLDTDLNLTSGRELIIPVAFSAPLSSSQNINGSSVGVDISKNVENTTKVPKSPTNKDNQVTKDMEPSTEINDKLNLKDETLERPYVKPVEGQILRGYNPTAAKNRNEGIDFYAPPGTHVKAVANGVVALVSKPVGGSGKIILIKHDKSVISIYGRIKDLKVSKGERVLQGQVIGNVEKSFLDENTTEQENYLHFELRKGTNSLDPLPLLQ